MPDRPAAFRRDPAARVRLLDARDVALPVGPLVDAVAAAGGVRHLLGGTVDGPLERAYNRARQSGTLTVAAADKLSTGLLGCHPYLLWGADYFGTSDPPRAHARHG